MDKVLIIQLEILQASMRVPDPEPSHNVQRLQFPHLKCIDLGIPNAEPMFKEMGILYIGWRDSRFHQPEYDAFHTDVSSPNLNRLDLTDSYTMASLL